jgi:superfamily II DNA or RNA helicase
VPLFKRTASHFQPGDRQRGEEYFEAGRVELEVEGTRARARVAGMERPVYRAGLDWSRVPVDRVLHAFCECQRFADGRPCKHLWASLLALAETGPDNQPPGKDRLSLRRDRAASWRDLGIPVEEEPREARGPGGPPDARRQQRRRSDAARGAAVSGIPTTWRSLLAAARERANDNGPAAGPGATTASAPTQAGLPSRSARPLRLMLNSTASQADDALVFDVAEIRLVPGGGAVKLQPSSASVEELETLLTPAPSAEDAAAEPPSAPAVVTALPAEPVRQARGRRGPAKLPPARVQRFRLPAGLVERTLPDLAARGILGWWDGRVLRDQTLVWDAGTAWELALRLDTPSGISPRLSGILRRGRERVPLPAVTAVLPGGLVLFPDRLARLALSPERDLPWLELLRNAGELAIPREELDLALGSLLEMPAVPALDLPEDLQLVEERVAPQPRLVLAPEPSPAWTNPPLLAELFFDYGDLRVSAGDPRPSVIHFATHKMVRRDLDAEHAALVRLLELGLRPIETSQGHGLELPPRDLPLVAEPLLAEGWAVEAQGISLHPPSPPALRVESGIDWFELKGDVDFAGARVELGALLSAIQSGQRFVELGDGSRGLLPAAWLQTYDSLAKLAHQSSEDGLRFHHSQALLVDALLATMPPRVDTGFAELRERLQSFQRIKSKKEPKGFIGTLRGYQREGLGWLTFLREFGLGGVLADDMGLGKTVQVLALLQATRGGARKKNGRLPVLVVAPRSLVYNWIDEAARFTPGLSVVEYGGPDREGLREQLGDYDLVVTTYGTLRRDVAFLATVELDTVILDEAQAIKNRDSQVAKASRLLAGRHRLALTGTPIENHLGELGSLFEFLNPGFLGRLPALEALATGRAASQQELALIAAGMRPFILRRTKSQVLQDLPPKTEQVLLTTLREPQRELYDRLRAAYQATLLRQVETNGVAASAIQVLEALLRLRQVACHPGLVDPSWEEAGSSKLEAMFEQMDEVLEEGHKLIVFSQFTKLLAYVQKHLDAEGVPYAYLDGSTRDRGAVVERFQTDPKTNVFLISLKAGGVGLNLTAAGYVYLLDPWWNPAVEAQAIDRAHRIGQTQPVFAYRLIARDTVEEKMLELQRSKKQLAEAILEGDAGRPLADLTADDLRLLLS